MDLDSLTLVTYDLVTGAAQQVAEIDLDGLAFEIRGFAGDPSGRLWAVGAYLVADGGEQPGLLPIDAATGTAGAPVDVQPVEPSLPAGVFGLAPFGDLLLAIGAGGLEAIDPKSGASVSLFPDGPVVFQGMDVGPDCALWTLEVVPVGGAPTFVHRMDLATGEITNAGGAFGIVGLAIAPPGGACGGAGPAAIPTLSPLALAALAGALAVAGLRVVRRRLGLVGGGRKTRLGHAMLARHNVCRPRVRAWVLAAVIAAPMGIVPGAAGDPIGYTVVPVLGESFLYRYDLGELTWEEIGPTGGPHPGGFYPWKIAFHADGTLYGIEGGYHEPLRLLSFDLATGEGQLVAELPIGDPDFALEGFAGDPDGGLWLSAWAPSGGVILSLDEVTGTVGEPVELAGWPFELASCGDLLLGIRSSSEGLVAIDPGTGETSLLFDEAPPVGSGMAVGPGGVLWTSRTAPIMPGWRYLQSMELGSGEITYLGPGTGVPNLAIQPPVAGPCPAGAPLTIPTLSPAGLAALVALLAAAAVWIGRRGAGDTASSAPR